MCMQVNTLSKPLILLFLVVLTSCWEVLDEEAVPCLDLNCELCDSANTTCLACKDQYYLDDFSESCFLCRKTISHCSLCQSDKTEVECTSCDPSYFIFDSPTACKLCSDVFPQCLNCTSNGTTVQCTQCNSGYYLYQQKCQTCEQVIRGCKTCIAADSISSFQLKPVRCLACKEGKVPSEDGYECKQCRELIEHCLQCAYQSQKGLMCSSYQEGYSLSLDGSESKQWPNMLLMMGGGGVCLLVLGCVVIWRRRVNRKLKIGALLDRDDSDTQEKLV